MLTRVIFLVMALVFVEAQRPPYAGSRNRYPVVLPQYLDEQQKSTFAAPSNSGVGNRIGSSSTNTPASAPVTTSTIPPDLPIEAHGDINLINRIKTWPREKQPFWYLNSVQLQEHRGSNRQPAQQSTK